MKVFAAMVCERLIDEYDLQALVLSQAEWVMGQKVQALYPDPIDPLTHQPDSSGIPSSLLTKYAPITIEPTS